MVRVKEIFTSIQGEGPFIGYKQLFIRFCGCNLNCSYCDTNFKPDIYKEYSTDELIKICEQNSDCHSVSLTGGEPLLQKDFLKDFLPDLSIPVYLETNGTMHQELSEIIDNLTYISADIKLPSSTGLKEFWKDHDKFFQIASKKYSYAKVVFTDKITNDEIQKTVDLCKKYDVELVLQPMMIGNIPAVSSEFMLNTLNKCLKNYSCVRLIPQIHKFINVE